MKKKGGGDQPPPVLQDDDLSAFRAAVADARPLPDQGRVSPLVAPPPPIPLQTRNDERAVMHDALSDHIPWDEIESGEELSYVRPGMSQMALRKLRRGHWIIESELDLHGLTRDEARVRVAEFLNACKKRGLRCVRIIHGKGLGSKNREPVLKNKVRTWLMQRDEVLAFTQARPADGGSGAVLVMLKQGK